MPLTKYHYEIEPIAQAYNEAISDRKVKDALTAKHGSYILEPENRAEFTNMAAEYKMQQLRIANDKIQAIKDRAKLEVDSLLTRYESEKVNLLTGSKLIDQYAQRTCDFIML